MFSALTLKGKTILKFVKNHRNIFLIALVTAPITIICGLLLYKWIASPKPAKIRVSQENSSYYFVGNSKTYQVKIGNKSTNEPRIEFSLSKSQDSSITFYPASARTNITKPTEKNNQVTFKNVYNDIDYSYETIPNGVKENIIINKPTIIKTFPFYLDFNGVIPQYITNDIKGTTFFDKDENYLFNFEKPFAVDAKGDRTDNIGILVKKDTESGRYMAILSLDEAWMNDPARSYPITVDPTIVHDASSDFENGSFNRSKDKGSGSSPSIESYYQETPVDPYTVAFWRMNEDSGTTTVADNSGRGHTGTSSSSTNVDTGLFGNARTFNGTSNYIDVSDSDDFSFGNSTTDSPFSIEAWIYVNSSGSSNRIIASKYQSDASYREWIWREGNSSNNLDIQLWDQSAGAYIGVYTNTDVPLDQWVHVAVTYTGGQTSSNIRMYFNGVEQPTTAWSSGTYTSMENTGGLVKIGSLNNTNIQFFNGKIDDLRISNIARSADEIALSASLLPSATYTSPVIDLTGASSWNSFSWTGDGFITGDGETATASAQSAIVAQWNFNETSGTTASVSTGNCGSTCNGTLSGFSSTSGQDVVAGSGWTSNNSRWGSGAIMYNGSSDVVTVTDNNYLDISNNLTIETWIKFDSEYVGYAAHPINKWSSSTDSNFTLYYFGTTGDVNRQIRFYAVAGGTWKTISAGYTVDLHKWYHVVLTYNSTDGGQLYINGQSYGSRNGSGALNTNGQPLRFGYSSSGSYFDGTIDTTRIYSRELTASEILSNYNSSNIQLQTRVGSTSDANDGSWEAWKPITNETQMLSFDSDASNWSLDSSSSYAQIAKADDSSLYQEGSGSLQFQSGILPSYSNTVGLWHLEETGGSSAYIQDSSGNNYDGTPTGSSATTGIIGTARAFTTSNDYINVGNQTSLSFEYNQAFSISVWIKTTDITNCMDIFAKKAASGSTAGYGLEYVANNGQLQFQISNADNSIEIRIRADGVQSLLSNGSWHYITATYNGNGAASGANIYIDGQLQSKTTERDNLANNSIVTTSPAYIGARNSTQFSFNGLIDEVRVTNNVRPTEEIKEDYRLGRDHYLNRTISSTDLSGKTTLPFYVAADRPGTYLTATVGNSAFANYQPDANTTAFWHMDEQSGSSAYIKDASGNGRNGTPTGTAFVQGKMGGARYFNGTSNFVTVPSTSVQAGNQITISFWEKTPTSQNNSAIWFEDSVGRVANIHLFYSNGNTYWDAGGGASGYDRIYAASPTGVMGQWNHWAFTKNASTGVMNIYVNGQLWLTGTGKTKAIGTPNTSGFIGKSSTPYYYPGTLDEVRIDNTARSATDIRQAYENGRRAHPITIDFGASLDSGNLIADSSDTSFTVDATAKGLAQMGSGLFLGDKIIVRENYNGTVYVAQGTVNSVTVSSGAVTVGGWDTGSTFPSGGYTTSADVLKWQQEFWSIENATTQPSNDINAITNLTLRLTNGAEGRTVWIDDLRSTTDYLADPTGSTIASSTGYRYFQYRTIFTQNSIGAPSASLTSVTLDYEANSPPNIPYLDNPSDTAINQSLTPQLKTTATDNDTDNLQYKIIICKDSAMSVSCQTFDQTSLQTGWSGQNADGNTTYTSDTQATYTVQTALDPITTYYWKSYAIDPSGSNTWSQTQTTPYSFTTTAVTPSAPTDLFTQGLSNPTNVTTLTPYFSAIHHDPNGDSANYYQILVNTSSNFTGTSMWDSTKTSMTTTTDGSRSPNINYNGSTLSWGATYYWKIKFWDTDGNEGAYSEVAQFTLNKQPNVPTLDLPNDTATEESLTPTFKTTGMDDNSDYLRYKIEICKNVAMTVSCQTYTQPSGSPQTGWTGQDTQGGTAYSSGASAYYTVQTGLDPTTIYYWRSYAIDPAGSNTWGSTQTTPYSFTTLAAPLAATNCRVQESPDDSTLTVQWDDNATNEDAYEVQRSVDGAAFATLDTGLPANTESDEDDSVAASHTYQYRVAPYFSAGPTYAAWCTTSTLTLNQGTFSIQGVDMSGVNLH